MPPASTIQTTPRRPPAAKTMFTRPTVRPLLCAALFATAATAAADPAAPRPVTDPAAGEGALTMEASPAARGFRLLLPAAPVEGERRDAMGRLLPTRAQDPYDRTLSDSFTLHDPVRAEAPARSQPEFATDDKPAPRSAAVAAPDTASYDLAPPSVAPVSPTSARDSHDAFATEGLSAPARTVLATWLDAAPVTLTATTAAIHPDALLAYAEPVSFGEATALASARTAAGLTPQVVAGGHLPGPGRHHADRPGPDRRLQLLQ